MRHRQERRVKSGYPWAVAGVLEIAEVEPAHRPSCLAQLVDSKSEALVPALN